MCKEGIAADADPSPLASAMAATPFCLESCFVSPTCPFPLRSCPRSLSWSVPTTTADLERVLLAAEGASFSGTLVVVVSVREPPPLEPLLVLDPLLRPLEVASGLLESMKAFLFLESLMSSRQSVLCFRTPAWPTIHMANLALGEGGMGLQPGLFSGGVKS